MQQPHGSLRNVCQLCLDAAANVTRVDWATAQGIRRSLQGALVFVRDQWHYTGDMCFQDSSLPCPDPAAHSDFAVGADPERPTVWQEVTAVDIHGFDQER